MEPHGGPASEHEVTLLLQQVRAGDAQAVEDLMPLIYRELHAAAERYMRRERPGHALQPTVLVHEAYLQLASTSAVDWQNRAHFFALAARDAACAGGPCESGEGREAARRAHAGGTGAGDAGE